MNQHNTAAVRPLSRGSDEYAEQFARDFVERRHTHDSLRQSDLSPDEWTLLLDAMISYRYERRQSDRICPRFFLTVQVEDAIEFERLDTKWGVQRDTLLAKVRAASPEVALAIIETVIDWREQNHNNGHFMPAPPPRVRRLLQA